MLKGYSERERREVHDRICKLAREFDDELALYKEHFPDGVCLEDVNAEPHGKDGHKLIFSSLRLRLLREEIYRLCKLSDMMAGPHAVRLSSYDPNAEELKYITAREYDRNALLKQIIVDLIYEEIKA